MTIPKLPTGARLALINWPGGNPEWPTIVAAAGPNNGGRVRCHHHVLGPLMDRGLLERMETTPDGARRFRLTQAGRKALDVLQSGVE